MGEQIEGAAPPAAEGGQTSIPLPRFNEVNSRMKAAEARAAELEAKLAALERKPVAPVGQAPGEPQPSPTPEPKSSQAPAPKADESELARLRLMAHHKVPESVVDDVLSFTSKGLEVEDAVALVRQKKPGAFGGQSTAGAYQPGAHSVSSPGSGKPPEPPKVSERQRVAAIRNNDARHSEVLKLAGRIVLGEKIE